MGRSAWPTCACAQNTLCDAFIDACEAAGIPRSNDFNGAKQEGAGYFQLTNRNGRRCSSAVAFLHPIRSRPNLTVITKRWCMGWTWRASG